MEKIPITSDDESRLAIATPASYRETVSHKPKKDK